MEFLKVVPIFLLLIIIQNEAVIAKKRNNKCDPPFDCACGEINNKTFDRIVDGKNTKPHAYPWIALLNYADNEKRIGAGTVINDFYILTAAHLVKGIPIKDFTIGLGVHNREKNHPKRYQSYKVTKSIIHEEYYKLNRGKGLIYISDIALLKVNRRIMFTDFVKPICLPNKNENIERKKATAIGWGKTKWNEEKFATILQEGQVEVLTRRECHKQLSIFHDSLICTSGSEHSPCRGDDGGPLFYTNQHGIAVQIGITSFVEKIFVETRCASDFPAFYASVTEFLDWIRKHTKATQYCYKEL